MNEHFHQPTEAPESKNNLPDSEISQTIKELTHLLSQNLEEFAQNILPANNIWDFARIKEEINLFLMTIFHNTLQRKNPDFILWFEQDHISKYHTKHDRDKVDLIELLVIKNKFYTEIIKNIVHSWKLDLIFTPEEKEDILTLIDSGVFSFLDELYVEWYKEVYAAENQGIVSKQLAYWWVKGGKVVALKELIDTEIHIDDEKLAHIHHPHLRAYLLLFSKFIKNGITDYDRWVDAEIHEVKSWQDRKTVFGFVAPMEDYMYPNVLVEPEFLLFVRNWEKQVNFSDFYGLSEEFFQNRFWMDRMTLDFVEPLLQTGDSAFGWFMWKAFPNDIELSKREWNCIILKDSSMKNVIQNAKAWLKVLLGDDFELDFDTLYNELIKEVTYHEFWHSLFIKWHNSLLEEAKATLFYYLQIYKEHKENPYQEKDIRKIIEFTLMDSVRNIERRDQSSTKKYLILTKINLNYLFASGLIYWEGEKLVIDTNPSKFDTFIATMYEMLLNIQTFYTLDQASLQAIETQICSNLDAYVGYHINRMYSLITQASQ